MDRLICDNRVNIRMIYFLMFRKPTKETQTIDNKIHPTEAMRSPVILMLSSDFAFLFLSIWAHAQYLYASQMNRTSKKSYRLLCVQMKMAITSYKPTNQQTNNSELTSFTVSHCVTNTFTCITVKLEWAHSVWCVCRIWRLDLIWSSFTACQQHKIEEEINK